MATECADVALDLSVLKSGHGTLDLLPITKLPISNTENVACDFKPGDSMDSLEKDTVSAPHSIAACDVALTPAKARLHDGEPAIFHVGIIGSTPLHEDVLTALASSTEVNVRCT